MGVPVLIIIKGLIDQEDITVINVLILKERATKYTKRNRKIHHHGLWNLTHNLTHNSQ